MKCSKCNTETNCMFVTIDLTGKDENLIKKYGKEISICIKCFLEKIFEDNND